MGTVPTPLDWIAEDGNFATAIMLEAGVGDPLTFLLDPPGAQVRRSTPQAIGAGTNPAIAFDLEDFDNDTMHSTVSNTGRLTCFTAGRYLVSGVIPYDAATNGTREARLVKNGAALIAGGRVIETSATGLAMVLPAIEVPMIVGDYVELQAGASTAVSTTATNGLFPFFRARWVGL